MVNGATTQLLPSWPPAVASFFGDEQPTHQRKGIAQGSFNMTYFGGNQIMQMYANFEGFPQQQCFVWVGNTMPVAIIDYKINKPFIKMPH